MDTYKMKHVRKFSLFEEEKGKISEERRFFLDWYSIGKWSVQPNGEVLLKGSLHLSGTSYRSLEMCPEVVSGDLVITRNPYLVSLKGSPRVVFGHYNCDTNDLTSLEGAPEEVGKGFSCSGNDLKSLKGAPRKVGKNFLCQWNPLESLEGSPEEIGGVFVCSEFRTRLGEWNAEGWIKVLTEGTPEAKKLIITLPQLREGIQKEIDKNPGKMAISLKGVWKLPEFKKIKDQLVIPKGFEGDFGTQSDLSDLGF